MSASAGSIPPLIDLMSIDIVDQPHGLLRALRVSAQSSKVLKLKYRHQDEGNSIIYRNVQQGPEDVHRTEASPYLIVTSSSISISLIATTFMFISILQFGRGS